MVFKNSELEKIRLDFQILNESYEGNQLVYFDNGATSQRPQQVIEAVEDFYKKNNANVHRGIHFLAERADDLYLEARKKVAGFIGANEVNEIVFTRNATEALNLVAKSYGAEFLEKGDEMVLTVTDHHSNIVPWQMLAEERGLVIRFLDVDEDGRLKIEELSELLSERTKLVCVSHVSNVTGVVNPVKKIVEMSHAVGAKVVVDGCQSVPHMKVDVGELGCDFFAFSAHKMCGPMGIGALWGMRELLEKMPPFLGGGSMIRSVGRDGFEVAGLPDKFDAGTPNVNGAVGMAAAVDYLDNIGMGRIEEYEAELMKELIGRVGELDFVKIIGPDVADDRLAILSFVVDGVHAHDVAEFLNSRAICVRAGHHCAQPLMERFDVVATARASLYFYNTVEEIDRFVEGLRDCYEFFKA